MPETLEGLLQQAGPAAPPAPANDPAPQGGTGGAAPSTTPASPAPAGQPEADELPQSVREYLAANPDRKDVVDLVNREMKAAWTPKLQEAAELRKRLEGIAESDLTTLRQIQAAAAVNPQVVREMLINYANSLAPAPPAAPADPYAGLIPQSPVEELVSKEVRELKAWRDRTEQEKQAADVRQFAAHATMEFARLAGEYQLTIPVDVQIQAAKLAQATGMGVEQALWATHQKAMSEALVRKARDEASSVVADKSAAAAGNPGALVPRSAPPEPNGKRDFRSIFAQTKEEMGIT